MRFLKVPCRLCKGEMKVEHGNRGYYYRCSDCKKTVNQRPVPLWRTLRWVAAF